MTNPTQPDGSNFFNSEPIESTPEKKGLTSRQKIAAAMAGIALTAGVIGGVTANVLAQRSPITAEAPANPGSEQKSIPAEAKSFVNEYSTRYEDPVSTYYAEKAYEAKGAKSIVLSNDFINKYEIKNTHYENSSSIGFDLCKLPLNVEVSNSLAINIFDQYTSKELSLYMNALAKNPTAEAEAVIDNQFMNSCSNTINPNVVGSAFPDDDKNIVTLMNTAKTVVAKYGSAANYNVMPGSNNQLDTNSTYFYGSQEVTKIDENKKVMSFQYSVNLLVSIDTYSVDKVSHTNEVIKNISLSIMRQPNTGSADNPANFTYISIGQFRIQ